MMDFDESFIENQDFEETEQAQEAKEAPKRGSRRGRKAADKVDVKAKLERSRQSARECRARKKLRYQYLEELVADREKAVFALRKEIEKVKKTPSSARGVDSSCFVLLEKLTPVGCDVEIIEKRDDNGIERENVVQLVKHKAGQENRNRNTHNKTFSQPKYFTHRQTKVLKHEKFSCDQCDKVFNKNNSLDLHIALIHSIGEKLHDEKSGKEAINKSDILLTCGICDKSFKNKKNLRVHILRFHNSDMVECDICGKGYKSVSLMNLHKKKVHDNDHSVECDICNKRLVDQAGLTKHKTNVHINVLEQFPERECNICNKFFYTASKLSQHKSLVHTDDSVTCGLCGKSCKNKRYLRNHVYRIHESADGSVDCDECGKSFKNKYLVTLHKKQVHVVDPVQCNICEKSFSNLVRLKLHVRKVHFPDSAKIRSDEKGKECLLCCKIVSNLSMHMKYTHGIRKNVTCDVCGKKFDTDRDLYLHKYHSHNNKPKDQVCNICSASFQFKHGLKYHILRVHMAEKSYVCEVCEKGFKEKAKLNIHMRLHNNVKPYDCDKCGKSFRWKSTCKSHSAKCTGINKTD